MTHSDLAFAKTIPVDDDVSRLADMVSIVTLVREVGLGVRYVCVSVTTARLRESDG